MHGTARAVSFFQFQTSISNHLEVIFVIGRYLVDSSVVACLFSFCFLDNCVQASGHILSCLVVFGIFASLPFANLYPSRSLLVRRIWNLVVPVNSSERLTLFASVHMSLIMCSLPSKHKHHTTGAREKHSTTQKTRWRKQPHPRAGKEVGVKEKTAPRVVVLRCFDLNEMK